MSTKEDLLTAQVVVINIGLREFAEALMMQDVPVVQVEWRPPAQGQEQLIQLLDKLL
ncbi:MAG: hypothetical protein M1136_00230 [Chloroflexi bacterium]|nr:hypothetical protein [Chloroflexota bacterium]MCL5074066.1 hypothetical protein [Chloroflexota bacterium]